MNRSPDTLAYRLKLAREMRDLTQGNLARAAGMKQPDISKIETGGILQTTGIARLAKALGVQVAWLELGEGPEPNWREFFTFKPRGLPVDQSASHPSVPNVLPTIVPWEGIVSADLEPYYRVAMPDDSMSFDIQPGDVLTFARDATPRAGQRVLVADKAGAAFVRRYRPRRAGHWKASPDNEEYGDLDSEDDGLRILGVLTRWESSGA